MGKPSKKKVKVSKKELKQKSKEPKKVKKVKKAKESKLDKKQDKALKKVEGKSTNLSIDINNVFTAIGLDIKHRAKPWQLVRHMGEVTVERNRNAFPYHCEVKLDGNFAGILVKDSKVIGAYTRTGNLFNNLSKLLKKFKSKADGFYLAELYVPKTVMSLEKLSGIVSPFRKNKLTSPQQRVADEETLLGVHDYITIEEFTTGKSEMLLKDRIKRLNNNIEFSERIHPVSSKTVKDLEALDKYAAKVIKKGGEGIVIKGENPWVAGHQNFHFMKKVRDITYDLKCIGFEEGEGKRKGQLSNLIFKYKDDTEVKADLGKGYKDEDRVKMLKACKKAKKGKTPVGKIFEVYALEESSKGLLRLPKVGELRHDKKESDF